VLVAYLGSCVAHGRLQHHDVEVSARVILDLAVKSMRLRALMALDEADQDPLGLKPPDQAIEFVTRVFAPVQP